MIAHEHFHSIFQRLVNDVVGKGQILGGHLEPLATRDGADSELPTKEFNRFMLRAVNEGMADFWAWVYTGDVRFMGRSLPRHSKIRKLDGPVKKLPTLSQLQEAIRRQKNGRITSLAYELGTRYARLFRQLAVDAKLADTREKRGEMAKIIVAALKSFAQRSRASWADTAVIRPEFLIDALKTAAPELFEKNCARISDFTKSIIRSGKGACK